MSNSSISGGAGTGAKPWSPSARCGGRCWYWRPLNWTGSGAGAGRAKGSSPGTLTSGGGGTLKRRGGIWGGIGWWGCRCCWGLSKVRFDRSSCWATVRARCGVFGGVSALKKKRKKRKGSNLHKFGNHLQSREEAADLFQLCYQTQVKDSEIGVNRCSWKWRIKGKAIGSPPITLQPVPRKYGNLEHHAHKGFGKQSRHMCQCLKGKYRPETPSERHSTNTGRYYSASSRRQLECLKILWLLYVLK